MEPNTDHDTLIRLDENVKEVLRRMTLQDTANARLEARVTQLENFRFFVLGAGSILGFIGGLLARYILR